MGVDAVRKEWVREEGLRMVVVRLTIGFCRGRVVGLLDCLAAWRCVEGLVGFVFGA